MHKLCSIIQTVFIDRLSSNETRITLAADHYYRSMRPIMRELSMTNLSIFMDTGLLGEPERRQSEKNTRRCPTSRVLLGLG